MVKQTAQIPTQRPTQNPNLAAQLKALQERKDNASPKRKQRSKDEIVADLELQIQRLKSGEVRRRGRQPKYVPHIYSIVQSLPTQFLSLDFKERADKARARMERWNRLEDLQTRFLEIAESNPTNGSEDHATLASLALEISELNRTANAE